MRITGTYQSIGKTRYFIPHNLPPANPALQFDIELITLYGETLLALGKLNEMIHRLPDTERFIKAYAIKEAQLSSSIEGIHTTLVDIYTQPLLDIKANKNTQLVTNYTQALAHAWDMIHAEIPISSRLFISTHEILMGTEQAAHSGHYRKQSVRVGELVPSPAPAIPELMGNLEQYINTNADNTSIPTLINAGLAHVQFETIHPFIDGNGRIGRMLIVLMLSQQKLISKPILYPSYYFKKHHATYYQKLDSVRTNGDFEGWLKFYLSAIRDSSIDAYKRAQDIERLHTKLIKTIEAQTYSAKALETRLRALSILFTYPIIDSTKLSIELAMSYNTAQQVITDFLSLSILAEENQQKRGKLFKFVDYFIALEKEY